MSEDKSETCALWGDRRRVPDRSGARDPRSYYSVANRLLEETPSAILGQSVSQPQQPPGATTIHGPRDLGADRGKLDYFVTGMGTGGTSAAWGAT